MINKAIYQKAKDYIESDDLIAAIHLVQNKANLDSNLKNLMSSFLNRLHTLKLHYASDTISFEHYVIQKNKVTISLLELLSKYLEQGLYSKNWFVRILAESFQAIKRSKFVISFLAAICLIVVYNFYMCLEKGKSDYKEGHFASVCYNFTPFHLMFSDTANSIFAVCDIIRKGDEEYMKGNYGQAYKHYEKVAKTSSMKEFREAPWNKCLDEREKLTQPNDTVSKTNIKPTLENIR